MIQLTDEQEKVISDAVHWYNYSTEQTFELSGSAGTGKSLVLQCIVSRLGLYKDQVAPCAYTGAAAIVMRRNNFMNARTIHSLLYSYKEEKDKKTKKVIKRVFEFTGVSPEVKLIIVDEAGMCDRYIRLDLEKTGVKIIVAGDINQLPPISGETAYFQNPDKIHYLTKIMRQNESSAIVMLSRKLLNHERLYPGNYGEVLVIQKSEFNNNLEKCIKAYGIVLCGLNRTRDSINSTVRETILRYNNPLPNIGERLINRKNLWDKEVDNGIALVNGTVGRCLTTVDVSKYDGYAFTIDFKPDFTEDSFTDLEVDYRYFLADYVTRKNINNIFDPTDGRAKMEYAYACTTHVAQGSQFNSGIYLQEFFPHNSNNLHYTGLTRFREKALYVIPDFKKVYPGRSTYKCEMLLPIEKVK